MWQMLPVNSNVKLKNRGNIPPTISLILPTTSPLSHANISSAGNISPQNLAHSERHPLPFNLQLLFEINNITFYFTITHFIDHISYSSFVNHYHQSI